MIYVDAAVIGGGILGCFAARELRRWKISTVLIEKEADVCTGITRANSAIVYPGYDNKPGSLKAALTVRGNTGMDSLCEELEVPFSRCGSLLVTYDAAAVGKLERKLENGRQNRVPGLKLLAGEEAEAMEPMLAPGVAAALYAPGTGTVNPWHLGIAAWENARRNGAETLLNTAVLDIRPVKEGYLLETTDGPITCRVVLNCAGLYADRVQALCFASPVKLRWDSAEYLVLEERISKPSRIIFHRAHSCGKGITAIPCTGGELLLSGFRKPLEEPFATTAEGLAELETAAKALLPELDLTQVIRNFGAVRPNPFREDGENIPDFCIENPGPGFYSLIGIKTPGLTCARELGALLAEKTARHLEAPVNPEFDPCRKAITDADHELLCLCRQITRAQVLEAIARGAKTVEAVKRRLGSGMGRCQGSRCRRKIEKLLEEAENSSHL